MGNRLPSGRTLQRRHGFALTGHVALHECCTWFDYWAKTVRWQPPGSLKSCAKADFTMFNRFQYILVSFNAQQKIFFTTCIFSFPRVEFPTSWVNQFYWLTCGFDTPRCSRRGHSLSIAITLLQPHINRDPPYFAGPASYFFLLPCCIQ